MIHRSVGPTGWTVAARSVDGLADAASVAAALPAPSFWLDSARTGYGSGRFSFLGAGSAHELSLHDVERVLEERQVPLLPDLPFDLQGGLVGTLPYEAGGECGLPVTPAPGIWTSTDRLVVLDHEQHRTWYLAVHDGSRADAADAAHFLAHGPALADPPAPHRPGHPQPVLARTVEQYRADVEECLRELRVGNAYEICLTVQAELSCEPACRDDDLALYLSLRQANPAPYAALLRLPGCTVLSSSPERFLRVDRHGIATSKPIKGTAARDADPHLDDRAARRLAADPKTRAENLMIVDLVRNDLSRVCTDIRVDPFLAVETYTTVHQLVSTVHGRLRGSVVDAVRATFPPGSMTGAPKHRAMQIIGRLEGRDRGVYSGAIGWLGLGGTADLAVAIRTAVRVQDRLTIGAGGAIVLDSDPDDEVAEMLTKLDATARGLA